MKKPTLQDILGEGIRYYAQLDDYKYSCLCDAPIPYKNTRENRLTILDVLNKGVQHYVQIAREEYKRIKLMEEKTRKYEEMRRERGPGFVSDFNSVSDEGGPRYYPSKE